MRSKERRKRTAKEINNEVWIRQLGAHNMTWTKTENKHLKRGRLKASRFKSWQINWDKEWAEQQTDIFLTLTETADLKKSQSNFIFQSNIKLRHASSMEFLKELCFVLYGMSEMLPVVVLIISPSSCWDSTSGKIYCMVVMDCFPAWIKEKKEKNEWNYFINVNSLISLVITVCPLRSRNKQRKESKLTQPLCQ